MLAGGRAWRQALGNAQLAAHRVWRMLHGTRLPRTCTMHPATALCTQPTREYVRPDNQLVLTEAELAEELPRMLNANNPIAPKNVARCAQALAPADGGTADGEAPAPVPER